MSDRQPGRNTALLLLDFQPMTLNAIEDSDATVAAAERALTAARSAGVACIHVRVAFTERDHAAVPQDHAVFGDLAAAGAAREGSPEASFIEPLTPRSDEHVVTKTRVSAFARTDLADLLDSRGIDRLVVAGVITSGAVLSTVLDASDRDLRLTVLGNASADFDPLMHESLLETLLARYAEVIDVDVFESRLQQAVNE